MVTVAVFDAVALAVAVAVFVGVAVFVAVAVFDAVAVTVAVPVGVTVGVGATVGVGVGPGVPNAIARLYAFTVPIPVAKSQPVCVSYTGSYAEVELDSTPKAPDGSKQLFVPGSHGTSVSPSVTS